MPRKLGVWSAALAVAMVGGFLPMVASGSPARAATNEVLILGATVSGGASSLEAQEVTAQGFTPVVVDDATWEGMTTSQFASYRAIVIGDPSCGSYDDTSNLTAALSNPGTWGTAVNGNVLIIGTDPVLHSGGTLSSGPGQLVAHGIDFAVAQAGKTGAYIDLSCAYGDTPANTPVSLLDGIRSGGFSVDGGPSSVCYNDAHIVATHPALIGLTDAELSNWSCSVHESFDTWPADYTVLAMARNFGSTFTASDGTVGEPYILASGTGLHSFPLSLSPLDQSVGTGSNATVTAQLLDGASAAPVSGAVLRFRVASGPNAGSSGTCGPASCSTDGAGHVTWSYTGARTGTDTIQTWLDTNGDGTPSVGEPQTTAAVTWTAPANPACAHDVLFIGARGAGENPYSAHEGLGAIVETTWTIVHNRLGDRVTKFALPYEAVDVPHLLNPHGSDIFDSVETGRVILLHYIHSRLDAWHAAGCAAPLKILLAGYSEGAWVVGNALNSMIVTDRASVAGVVLFGDPKFDHASPVTRWSQPLDGLAGPRRPYVPSDMTSHVRSFCHEHDGVCNDNLSNRLTLLRHCLAKKADGYSCPHFAYADPGPEAQVGGNYLAQQVTG